MVINKIRDALVRFLRGGDIVIMDMSTYMAQQKELEERLCEIEKLIADYEPPDADAQEEKQPTPAEIIGEWLYGIGGEY